MNFYPFSLSFTALSSLILGGFVIYKNPRSPINITWGLGCLAVALWSFLFVLSFFSPSPEAANLIIHWINISSSYIPVLITHFCKELTGVKRDKKGIIYFGYASAIFITLTGFTKYFCSYQTIPFFPYYVKSGGPLYWFFTIHFIFQFSYGEYLLIRGLMDSKSTEKKNQIKYILFGITLGYIGGLTTFLPAYGIMINLFAAHFVWLYAAVISYAILKHKLMNIEIVIKRTIFYSLFVFVLSAVYVGIVFMVHHLLVDENGQAGFLKTFDSMVWFSLPPLFGTIIFLSLGLLFLFHKPRSHQKTLFSMLCFETFVWQFIWFYSFYCPIEELPYVAKVAYVGITLLPFTFYHFIVSYIGRKREGRYVKIFYCSALLLLAILFPTNLYVAGNRRMGWGNFSFPGVLYPFFIVLAFMSMMRGVIIIWQELRLSSGSSEKTNQLKYLFAGFFLYFFCTLDFMQVYGAPWYPIGSFFFLLSAIFISYAILKHHLLDIRVVIKKTLFYSALTVLISVIYLSLVLFFYLFFIGKKSSSSLVLNFAGVLFIAMTFKPLEMLLNRFLERRFFKGTIGEISEQKAFLETELERRERLKSVGILAAGMAHEIKNPITAIQTFAEYLPKKYDDPQFRESFSRLISIETKRVSEIVRDLLLFARPSEPCPEVCDVRTIMKSVLDLLVVQFTSHKIEVGFDSQGSSHCFADPSQMKQAFLNIIMNAIDAMKLKGSGRLRINIKESNKSCEIAIEDSGIGISPEKIQHLFDPFYTDKEGGTGLGLAITHSIIEKNRGKIEVESVTGLMTAFKIILPSGTPA